MCPTLAVGHPSDGGLHDHQRLTVHASDILVKTDDVQLTTVGRRFDVASACFER